jgi:hypothetical protein
MFDAFMPVFCILIMKILYGVISSVADEGVWVCGASHEEFVCEEVDELADWDHLEMSVKIRDGGAPGKVPYNTEAF